MLVSFGIEYKTKIEEKTEVELDTSVDESRFDFEETRVLFPFDPGEVAGPVSQTKKAQVDEFNPDARKTNDLEELQKLIELSPHEEEFVMCSSYDPSDDFEHTSEEFWEESTSKNERKKRGR